MPSQPNLGGKENTGCNWAAPGKARPCEAPEFRPEVLHRGAVSPELRPTPRVTPTPAALYCLPRPSVGTPDSRAKGPDGAEECRVPECYHVFPAGALSWTGPPGLGIPFHARDSSLHCTRTPWMPPPEFLPAWLTLERWKGQSWPGFSTPRSGDCRTFVG